MPLGHWSRDFTFDAEQQNRFIADLALQHGRRLTQFLARRRRDRAEAPDLAQEVYLRLLRAERHEHIRSPEAYLLTVASHLLREHSVKQAAIPPLVDIESLASELRMADTDDPAVQTESQQRLRILERALEKLSPKAQAVLLLHRRDGFSLEEIGAQFGLSRSMSKKYLTQALSHCRQRLERAERGKP